MPGPVVADTNALMMPVESDVRLFDELERIRDDAAVLVPDAVVAELEDLADDANGADTEAAAARVALDLVERCEVRETEATYADDAVLELAERSGAPAVTNDRPLRDRLLESGVEVIGLRGRNRLTVTKP